MNVWEMLHIKRKERRFCMQGTSSPAMYVVVRYSRGKTFYLIPLNIKKLNLKQAFNFKQLIFTDHDGSSNRRD